MLESSGGLPRSIQNMGNARVFSGAAHRRTLARKGAIEGFRRGIARLHCARRWPMPARWMPRGGQVVDSPGSPLRVLRLRNIQALSEAMQSPFPIRSLWCIRWQG
ncbi:TPA: hypothetical protein OM995_001204 [Pseudomonas aeruginosa]|nr:hypothetical protein [Pseudomonas aeruginosa]HCF1774325.1 hypothetical protein [Pseudomonas aeruginosa]HCF6827495.1 hypothetical protein [Pseudomonas aeruginosa]HCR1180529.1 hypothetical protein [Pseudomonas aeruginosa]